MNTIHAYEGISKSEIMKLRITSTGKKYSLNHPKELIVSMRYTPMESTKNTQGWESDQRVYWSAVMERCPQCLDSKNQKRLADGHCPRVNKTFIDYFPQYKDFNEQKLYHHHIGGNGDAVAMPKDAHTGFGEVHNIERQLSIRENAENYTRECHRLCAKDQKLYGKTSIEFQKLLSREKDQMYKKSNQLAQFRREHGEPGTTSPAAREHNITPENERASIREQIRDNQSERQNKIEQKID